MAKLNKNKFVVINGEKVFYLHPHKNESNIYESEYGTTSVGVCGINYSGFINDEFAYGQIESSFP